MRKFNLLWIGALFWALYACSSSQVYYVDSVTGNDAHKGTDISQPLKTFDALKNIELKPGDKVLLKRGSTFWGELEISAQGEPENPIVIGAYGEGEKLPCIVGYDHSLYAVRVYNSNYLTVQDLEIVNTGTKALPKRTGLMVECADFGVSHNIRINRVVVRDVNGSLVKEEGGGCGIYIVNRGDSIRSRFDSLTIENCHIVNCTRNAMIWSGYYDRRNWYPNKHTVVRYNLIEGVPGDGIVPIGCDSTLIEYNVMRDAPDILPATEAAAGIWPWSCDNTVIQFNEVSDHKAPWDAQGFDSDYNCRNTLIQYNYSHNNYGGLVLVCNNGETDGYSCGNIGSIIRYNISIGDGIRPKKTRQGMFSPGIHIAGPVKQTLIERNIVHLNGKPSADIDRSMVVSDSWGGYADSTCFRQNLFYSADRSVFKMTSSTHNAWEGNFYVGRYDSIPERNANDSVALFYTQHVLGKDRNGYEYFRDYMKTFDLNGTTGYAVDSAKIEQFWTQVLDFGK